MRTIFKVFALVGLAALAMAQEGPDYSDKKVGFVFQVSTSGAATPKQNYFRTADPADEPKVDNYLTPLGQRQQFLIGTELRSRYVMEVDNFLNASYDISQIWIQSTFDAKSIMSAQAQLLGLYPPYSSQNYLNEWQQQNAVPPLIPPVYKEWEPYIKQWQEELGSKALLDNINTFPINMVAHEDDFMLRLDQENCPLFKETYEAQYDQLEIQLKSFQNFFSRLEELFEVSSVDAEEATNMCSYLKWADLHNVALTISYTSSDLSECNRLDEVLLGFVVDVDASLEHLGAQELLSYLNDHLSTVSGSLAFRESLHFKKFQEWNERSGRIDDLTATNANEQPDYVFLMTEDANIKLFLAAISAGSKAITAASIPSSTIFFNMMLNEEGDTVVEGLFNDEPILLGGCQQSPCHLETFKLFLKSQIKYDDVKGACASQAQEKAIEQ